MNALGLIEVVGYLSAIKAVDIALKSAYVNLIDIEKVSSGIVTVKITGDVDAVTEALHSTEIDFKKNKERIKTHVIARPSKELEKIVFKIKDTKENSIKKVDYIKNENPLGNKNNEKILNEYREDLKNESDIINPPINKDLSESLKYSDITKEKLLKMRAQDVKDLARRLKITGMTNKEIKMTKKNVLIQKILKCLKEEVK